MTIGCSLPVDFGAPRSHEDGRFGETTGALQYVNCIGDETKPGNETSYPQAVKLKDVKLSLNRGPFTNHGKIGIEQIKPLCRMGISRS
jgi:Protein of unknown function (DUF1428)